MRTRAVHVRGGVYVVDARGVSPSNVVEGAIDQTLSVFDLRVHLLNAGDDFDLKQRRPISRAAEDAMARVGEAALDEA